MKKNLSKNLSKLVPRGICVHESIAEVIEKHGLIPCNEEGYYLDKAEDRGYADDFYDHQFDCCFGISKKKVMQGNIFFPDKVIGYDCMIGRISLREIGIRFHINYHGLSVKEKMKVSKLISFLGKKYRQRVLLIPDRSYEKELEFCHYHDV